MNKIAIIGIVVLVIIIGIVVIFSLDSFFILENDDISSEPILEKEGEETKNESKPVGRDLSIEFDEKMGLSAP